MSTALRPSLSSLPLALIAGAWLAAAPARAQSITCVSVNAAGQFADDDSGGAFLSRDGRWLSFGSRATNLIPGGAGYYQIYVRDLLSGTIERVSVSTAGGPGNGHSWGGMLSVDGRYVFIPSDATNLVPGDTNGDADAFLRDRVLGTTERISVATGGVQANNSSSIGPHAMTADGQFVLFSSSANNLAPGDTDWTQDVFLRDRRLGTTVLVSAPRFGTKALAYSQGEGITPDGRFLWFTSEAPNLVVGDANGVSDLFVLDRATNVLELGSLASSGAMGDDASSDGMLSDDGRYLVFLSRATNLVSGDTNGYADVFVRDRKLGTVRRVSVSSGGQQGDFDSYTPIASPDARFVGYSTLASNLVPDDFNMWDDNCVFDTLSGGTTLVSRTWQGASADDYCVSPTISADGRLVAFESGATNLLATPLSPMRRIYLVDRGAARLATYCPLQPTSLGCAPAIGASGTPSMTATTPFEIHAAPLVSNKTGLMFYGTQPKSTPFHGGTLCVAQPVGRTPLQSSGGNPPPDDCSGAFAFDFNAFVQSSAPQQISAGVEVFCQYWFRDPAAPSHVGLSDALQFVVQD